MESSKSLNCSITESSRSTSARMVGNRSRHCANRSWMLRELVPQGRSLGEVSRQAPYAARYSLIEVHGQLVSGIATMERNDPTLVSFLSVDPLVRVGRDLSLRNRSVSAEPRGQI